MVFLTMLPEKLLTGLTALVLIFDILSAGDMEIQRPCFLQAGKRWCRA